MRVGFAAAQADSPFARISATFIALLLICLGASGQTPATNTVNVRFVAVDIYVDSKDKPLAAYQLEFFATNGAARIVGIEGGEHPVFREAPHYDPKAMQHDRVILAAFSTEPAGKLPTGKTRVATIHLQLNGPLKPQFELKLEVAANLGGNKIRVETSLAERMTP
jgi:hypothetical protein